MLRIEIAVTAIPYTRLVFTSVLIDANATESKTGVKIPNDFMPTIYRAILTIVVMIGSINISIIVDSLTPRWSMKSIRGEISMYSKRL